MEEEENHTIKFDFKHFRERQALLVILVLGEAVAASTITESEEGAFGKTNFIAALCIVISFLLRTINMDCPNAYEFKEFVEPTGFMFTQDPDQKLLPFFGIFFLPLFYCVILASTTLIATGFRLALGEKLRGRSPARSESTRFGISTANILASLAVPRYAPSQLLALKRKMNICRRIRVAFATL